MPLRAGMCALSRETRDRGDRAFRGAGHGRPQDAPTIETILLVTFLETIQIQGRAKRFFGGHVKNHKKMEGRR